jgi:hypothetical protein
MVFVMILFFSAAIFTLVLSSIISIVFQLVFTGNISGQKVKGDVFSDLERGVFSNTIYVLFLLFLLSFNTNLIFAITLVSFVLISYSQKHLWSLVMEEKLTQTPLSVRKYSLGRLLDEDCIITHFTLHKYVYDLMVAEYHSFKEMINDSIEDINVAILLKEPKTIIGAYQKDIYNIQKNFFKFKKVELNEPVKNYSKEDLIKLQEAIKFNRDPRKAFNFVRRLPWKLTYDYKSNLFFKLFSQNMIVFYNFFKTTLVAVLLMVIYFIYTIFFFKIQFLKQLSVWFVIGMIYFWLMSGFNFFLKRYQYGKFTSQIQRFWKRTNTYFWLIEGFLILLFFYYFLNSSQEPLYMYDYSALNQEYLISLYVVGINVILLSLVIYFMYFTLLRINSNSWNQLNLYLILISSFIFFSFFIETYQFYYVISTFNERFWSFNEEENLWFVDIENPIIRTKQQYLMVCLIAKYWHFLFIFLSWVFFLIKSYERRKVTYVLFGANLQNMVLLYVLNFACYLQWFKWIYRRFFDLPYTWFMVSIDNKFLFRLFFELKLLISNLLTYNLSLTSFNGVVYKSLFLWNVDSLCMWKFI